MLCSVLFLTVSAVAFENPTNYPKLKAVEWAQGKWQRSWTAKVDSDTAKKGDRIVKEWHFAWTPNQNALLIHQILKVNGKVTGQLDALFGWNQQEEEIQGSGFTSTGTKGGSWALTPNKDSFTITAGSSEWVFKQKGKDALVVTDSRERSHTFQKIK